MHPRTSAGIFRIDDFILFYPCTLRAAISEINALPPPAPGTHHTINFNIGYGVQTICVGGVMISSGCAPSSGLGFPPITQPVVIDGSTQQNLLLGTVMHPRRTVSCTKVTGRPCIQLDGTNAGASDGLTLGAAPGSIIAAIITTHMTKISAAYGSTRTASPLSARR